MYLTYADYQTMGGTLDENSFKRYEFKARMHINAFTFNRLKDETYLEEEPETKPRESVRQLMFELIGLLNQTDESKETLASESSDGYSVSYAVKSQNDVGNSIKVLVYQYLINEFKDGVSVLYRGVQ